MIGFAATEGGYVYDKAIGKKPATALTVDLGLNVGLPNREHLVTGGVHIGTPYEGGSDDCQIIGNSLCGCYKCIYSIT